MASSVPVHKFSGKRGSCGSFGKGQWNGCVDNREERPGLFIVCEATEDGNFLFPDRAGCR